MEIKVDSYVHNSEKISHNKILSIISTIAKSTTFDSTDTIAYPPFINSHDHLISNWFPKAGDSNPYQNVNFWVEEMKYSKSFLERNKIWLNDGSFELTDKNANMIIQLGIYKNMFSGCSIVQDHIPNQKDKYYKNNPINILKKYSQCHSISMGNWWGGDNAVKEWEKTQGEIPFIIHLGEGKDELAKSSFGKFEKLNLLQPNTLLVHGIALTEDEIKRCGEAKTSICWCPESNLFLIGETLDIQACLNNGVNVTLGTDSTMSGSVNLLAELKFAKKHFPQISAKDLFKMITINATIALNLDKDISELKAETSELLLLKKRSDDPFKNILECGIEDIELFVHDGKPLYGNTKFLEGFEIDLSNYYKFCDNRFVIGHPEKVTDKINSILGYKKDFPFLPI